MASNSSSCPTAAGGPLGGYPVPHYAFFFPPVLGGLSPPSALAGLPHQLPVSGYSTPSPARRSSAEPAPPAGPWRRGAGGGAERARPPRRQHAGGGGGGRAAPPRLPRHGVVRAGPRLPAADPPRAAPAAPALEQRRPLRGDAEQQLGGDRAQPALAAAAAAHLQALLRVPGQVLGLPLRRQRLRGLQGLLPPQHPEEHGLHVPPGQELHHQQGDAQPLPVLPPAEVLRSRHVQGVRPQRPQQEEEGDAQGRVLGELHHHARGGGAGGEGAQSPPGDLPRALPARQVHYEQQLGAAGLPRHRPLGQVQRVVHQVHHQDGGVRQAAPRLHHAHHRRPDHPPQSRLPRHPDPADLHALHAGAGHHDLLGRADAEPHADAQRRLRAPHRPRLRLRQPAAPAGDGRRRDGAAQCHLPHLRRPPGPGAARQGGQAAGALAGGAESLREEEEAQQAPHVPQDAHEDHRSPQHQRQGRRAGDHAEDGDPGLDAAAHPGDAGELGGHGHAGGAAGRVPRGRPGAAPGQLQPQPLAQLHAQQPGHPLAVTRAGATRTPPRPPPPGRTPPRPPPAASARRARPGAAGARGGGPGPPKRDAEAEPGRGGQPAAPPPPPPGASEVLWLSHISAARGTRRGDTPPLGTGTGAVAGAGAAPAPPAPAQKQDRDHRAPPPPPPPVLSVRPRGERPARPPPHAEEAESFKRERNQSIYI